MAATLNHDMVCQTAVGANPEAMLLELGSSKC